MRVLTQFTTAALALAVLPAVASTHPHHGRTSATVRHTVAVRKPAHVAAPAMPSDRATAIQQALIQRGYLSGEPTGTWDSQSVAAMQKLQADNGWQTKYTPDSRALIKLGLGGSTPPQSAALAEAQ